MTDSGERPILPAIDAEAETHALPPANTPTTSFHEILDSLTRAGASYAALIHQNGVSVADSSATEVASHKRDELAILATAMISASQALARSLNAGTSGPLQQDFQSGGLVLQPVTADHWLLAAASDRTSLDLVATLIPVMCPALKTILEAEPGTGDVRFMDDIEFTDLSDLTFG